jgi:nucleoside-diphosphate-sugar epimerase
VERVSELIGREPPGSAASVDYLMRPYAYSIEKAGRELGYVPAVGLTEGMTRVIEWLASGR